jgi:hypothetical protein
MNLTIPADLLELKTRFETWRTNRKYRVPSAEGCRHVLDAHIVWLYDGFAGSGDILVSLGSALSWL